jgi:hypothetical protein
LKNAVITTSSWGEGYDANHVGKLVIEGNQEVINYKNENAQNGFHTFPVGKEILL